jgi:hypothetical protein
MGARGSLFGVDAVRPENFKKKSTFVRHDSEFTLTLYQSNFHNYYLMPERSNLNSGAVSAVSVHDGEGIVE